MMEPIHWSDRLEEHEFEVPDCRPMNQWASFLQILVDAQVQLPSLNRGSEAAFAQVVLAGEQKFLEILANSTVRIFTTPPLMNDFLEYNRS